MAQSFERQTGRGPLTTFFRFVLVVATALWLLGPAATATAQATNEGGADETVEEGIDAEQPVESAPPAASRASQETEITGGTLAIVAYLVLWVLVFGLVVVTLRRQSRLDEELGALEQRLDQVIPAPDED